MLKKRESMQFGGKKVSFSALRKQVLRDYRLACESREASLLGRKEVLMGKAKFGIFGDGKELAQLALAHVFKAGDFRSGYYRDQTFMFATETGTLQQFFAQLYAETDLTREPFSGGRQMNSHFSTHSLDDSGQWVNLMRQKNSAADSSPTSSQMSRALGLALASKLYRKNPALHTMGTFSNEGSEVCFCTIGDASTSEGQFWETVNAAGVMRVPLVVSVWDDGYGISVAREHQTTKGSISEILSGFQTNKNGEGLEIYTAKGWDYEELCRVYQAAARKSRKTHTPALVHVQEVTQPQGHSTSGSHERYKSKDRLKWEYEYCCNHKFNEWILEVGLADPEELEEIENESKDAVKSAQRNAWSEYRADIDAELKEAGDLIVRLEAESAAKERLAEIRNELLSGMNPIRRDILTALNGARRATVGESSGARLSLIQWLEEYEETNQERYSQYLYSESADSALNVAPVYPVYGDSPESVNGNKIIQLGMDAILSRDDRVCIFGEDVGIGDVNHGLVGLPEKYGSSRVFDAGIRENTIIGQGIGLAMRGLRPIAEIQYLDYLLFGFQPLADDLATLHYRTRGRQKAPLIVRTRGHRLEGIWHTGSPMGMIIHALRGMYIAVPRNMTQAIGLYNTLLDSDDPALVIECLNGYGHKELLPENLSEIRIPLGEAEVLREGSDVTLVTYGSCCRLTMSAAEELERLGVDAEVIDVQTLVPFDLSGRIRESLKKTSRVVFIDEDVPGGASAYMMQQVLEIQGGYYLLDSLPLTITACEHRSPYGSDGDYFAKVNVDDIVSGAYSLMHESNSSAYPEL